MIYCPDCELWFDESDISDDQIDQDGTVWCECGCEMQSIDPDPSYNKYGYDTLEEKYL